MIVGLALAIMWLMTGCTLSPSSSSGYAAQTQLTLPPRLTITVYERETETPTPPPRTIARAVLQPPPDPIPTPHVYIIKENDTLLDIALRLDVPFDDLLRANPNIDPSVLQIGQEIIIPADGTLIDTADVEVVLIDVDAPICTVTSAEGVICLGIVTNNQTQPIQQVSVEVQLFDEDDQVLAEETALIEQAFISPGELAPYHVLFAEVVGETVSRVTAQQVSGILTDTLDSHFAQLEAESASLLAENDLYQFSAQLVNRSEGTVARPRVVITLLDDANRPYGYRIWDGTETLSPNGQVDMQVPILTVPLVDTPPALNYHLHTEARIATSPGE